MQNVLKYDIAKLMFLLYNSLMDDKILQESKKLNKYDLNFTNDNFHVIIHNFLPDTFEGISGYEMHQHACHELHYIKSGTGMVHFNDIDYPLKSGDLYLISPYTPHKQIIHSSGMVEYSLRFDIKQLSAHSANPAVEEEAGQIISLLSYASDKIYANQYAFEVLFEKTFMEAYKKEPGYYLALKQGIMEIILKSSRLGINPQKSYTPYELPANNLDIGEIELITEYIYNNIDSPITNSVLAQYVHLSERQLQRLVKRRMGMTPHQYVTHIRINYVKTLLDKRQYSLKTISEMTGFSSEFHLSSTFKKCTGVAPSEYLTRLKDRYMLMEAEQMPHINNLP